MKVIAWSLIAVPIMQGSLFSLSQSTIYRTCIDVVTVADMCSNAEAAPVGSGIRENVEKHWADRK
jgi:hypothetical protein